MIDDSAFRDARPIDRLLAVMARLRDKERGCPWDVAQDFATIAPYTVEEAYEVADAIDRRDFAGLREELGDLLLQIAFHARMAEEEGRFDFDDVAETIVAKMIRRHPHVFGDIDAADEAAVHANWERIKAEERAAKGAKSGSEDNGALAGVARALPALVRAEKLQKRASRVGFDWGAPAPILDKIAEEIGELRAELPIADKARLSDELGDVLFAVVNLARHLGIDPETALHGTNAKFERRFGEVERRLRVDGRKPEDSSLEEMEALWQAAKEAERTSAM
ncbi:MAG TPA: nucleoside triphosphate pyrophosphohydrolase [Alphaproteobacteria bacterium]|nr:nucleoside triphosphate pyrophosphohydrolase [Alphaproteobacteria bacterium]